MGLYISKLYVITRRYGNVLCEVPLAHGCTLHEWFTFLLLVLCRVILTLMKVWQLVGMIIELFHAKSTLLRFMLSPICSLLDHTCLVSTCSLDVRPSTCQILLTRLLSSVHLCKEPNRTSCSHIFCGRQWMFVFKCALLLPYLLWFSFHLMSFYFFNTCIFISPLSHCSNILSCLSVPPSSSSPLPSPLPRLSSLSLFFSFSHHFSSPITASSSSSSPSLSSTYLLAGIGFIVLSVTVRVLTTVVLGLFSPNTTVIWGNQSSNIEHVLQNRSADLWVMQPWHNTMFCRQRK